VTKAVIDTSVIIEYIDRKGELHEQAKQIISTLLTNKLEGVVPHPTLAETYYVTTRLYRALGLENPQINAIKLIEWLYRLPTILIPNLDLSLAIEVGKAKLSYRLALTDCYILATSKLFNCTALFKKREREMVDQLDDMQKNYQLVFLEDYK
jgi:predicted nucleic acid-binding protein